MLAMIEKFQHSEQFWDLIILSINSSVDESYDSGSLICIIYIFLHSLAGLRQIYDLLAYMERPESATDLQLREGLAADALKRNFRKASGERARRATKISPAAAAAKTLLVTLIYLPHGN
jgi:hypothetical protein